MKFAWPLMTDNIRRQDLDAVISYLQQDSPRLTHGPQVRLWEQEWSRWLGVKYSVFVNSGSSANLLTLAVLRHFHGCGDVIVPPLTWVSDIAAVLHNGFTPVFADIDLHTLGLDTQEVIKKITPRTKAVFITHVLGYNALTRELLDVLREKNILLIEDACESHGATSQGRKVGTFGWASNLSFYYAHHLSTVEGGMICTDDEELYETCRMLRSHGLVREMDSEKRKDGYQRAFADLHPEFIFPWPAWNVRPTEIQAILGRTQLPYLDENIAKRNENLRVFLSHLDPKRYYIDFSMEGCSNYALTLLLREPDQIFWKQVTALLEGMGVEFRRGMSGGGNQLRQPYLRYLYDPESCPNADYVHHYGLYIGNYPGLPQDKIVRLCKGLNCL